MKKLKRFVLVGLVGTTLDVLVFSVALLLGAEQGLSRAMGYTVGTVWSFLLNQKWVFDYSGRGSRLLPFLLTYFVSGSLAVIVQHSLGLLITDDFTYVKFAISTVLAAALNYTSLKFYVFRN